MGEQRQRNRDFLLCRGFVRRGQRDDRSNEARLLIGAYTEIQKKKERDKEKLKWDEWTREKFFDGLGETEHALNILNESRSQTE